MKISQMLAALTGRLVGGSHVPTLLSHPAPMAQTSPSLPVRLDRGATSFRYLSQSDAFVLDDVDDAEQFRCSAARSCLKK